MKISKLSLLTLLYIFFCTSLAMAQEGKLNFLNQNGSLFKSFELRVKKNILYANMNPNFRATSMSIEFNGKPESKSSYVFLGEADKYNLEIDADANAEDSTENTTSSSQLIIAKNPFNNFSFFSGNIEGVVTVKLLYAAPLGKEVIPAKKHKAGKQPAKNRKA